MCGNLASLTFRSPTSEVRADLDTMPQVRWVTWAPPSPEAAPRDNTMSSPEEPGRRSRPSLSVKEGP
ncbi:hypothetical protein FAIPA1_230082 [Frankia sp. AiPs1]